VALSVDAKEQALAVVREGLERGRALHLHYYVPTRDERTERTVDPLRLLLVDGRWYLEAWSREVAGVRCSAWTGSTTSRSSTSRRPRRRGCTCATSTPGSTSPSRARRWYGCGWPAPARWVAEYYPVENVREVEDPPGGLAVAVRTA
jgi:proteasome accessory factor C